MHSRLGTTVCKLPKVQALKMSYSELVADKSHHKYLTWVQSGKGRGGRFAQAAQIHSSPKEREA